MEKTLTDVCNAALQTIGESPIEGVYDAGTTSTHACLQLHLQPVIREVQSILPWPEITRAETLADGEFDGVRKSVGFALPSDCLRVTRVSSGVEDFYYYVESDRLFVETTLPLSEVSIRYVYESLNPEEWSPLLFTSVVKLLAARVYSGVAHNIEGANGLENLFFSQYLPGVRDHVYATFKVRSQNTGATLDGVCESALRELGMNLEPDWRGSDSVSSVALRGCLVPVCKEVQSLTAWPELVAVEHLSYTGQKEVWGDTTAYKFYLPDNCLRIISCSRGSSSASRWVEEGKYVKILSREGEVPVDTIRYVKYSNAPAVWSSELYSLTVKLLAARVAATALGDPGKAQNLESAFWQMHRPRVVSQVLNRAREKRLTLKYDF